MEDEFAEHSIKPICNTAIKEVWPGEVRWTEGRSAVPLLHDHSSVCRCGCGGGDAGTLQSEGFVNIDAYQANPKYKNIYSVGVCVAIPPVERTPIPTGAPNRVHDRVDGVGGRA